MGAPRTQALTAIRSHFRWLGELVRWKALGACALLVTAGAVEGVGLVLLVPLLESVGLNTREGPIAGISLFVSRLLSLAGIPHSLVAVLGLYILMTALQALLHRWSMVFNIALVQEMVSGLRKRFYRAIVEANWLFLSRSRGTEFIHLLTTEMDRVGNASYQLLAIVTTGFVASVYLLFALRLSAPMTALVFASGGVLLATLSGGTRRAQQVGADFSRAMGGMHGAALEHLAGIKTAKSHGAEGRTIDIFSDLSGQVASAHVETARSYANTKAWFDIGSVSILAILLLVAVRVLQVPTATLLLLLFLFARIMPRLSALQQNVQFYLNQLPSVDHVTASFSRAEAAAERTSVTDSRPIPFGDRIQFEGVWFRYDDRAAWAIRDLDLTIEAGATMALVGPSGSGKSTMADLVTGLLMPSRGRITVDGEPLTLDRLRSWRAHIGYVAQDTFLFHDSVRANLLWAQPTASDDDLRQALRMAAADRFVYDLPDGLDTLLGDRGVRLSGGERQRLALARALLRKPALLILDEATSSLDSENECRIRDAIDRLHGSMTILVIAHRLSTIRGADVIHVLEQGTLVESGNWDRLISTPVGRFRELKHAQDVAPVGPVALTPSLSS